MDNLSQDQEYCFINDHTTNDIVRVGFHEYDKIYSIPGLYEHLFYDLLKCASPQKICELLSHAVQNDINVMKNLCVFDLGAGNGIVGEILQKQGVPKLYGMDIIPEAKAAAVRDRPNVYQKYYQADLTQLPPTMREELISKQLNCMVSAGSLGFGDISVKAFKEGLNLLANDAWVIFTIHSDFLSDNDCYGFCSFFHKIINLQIFELQHQETYCHRLSAKGDAIYYTAVLGKKLKDVPDTLIPQ
jgi:predicted TPR repeat methyltransferase